MDLESQIYLYLHHAVRTAFLKMFDFASIRNYLTPKKSCIKSIAYPEMSFEDLRFQSIRTFQGFIISITLFTTQTF